MMKEENFEANLGGEIGLSDDDKRNWFRRMKKGILTPTKEKADAPEGLWTKCPECKYTCTISELKEHLYVCPKCEYHNRIGSEEYFEFIFDENQYTELFANIVSKDYLCLLYYKPAS